MQKEMPEVFNDLCREWAERATSEAELVVHAEQIDVARAIPEAFSAYRE
jgi:hypothetical protein